MQLTVHIGTTKTGTSSIQRYLHQNRTKLLEQGILVPRSLGSPVHTKAVVASLPHGKSPDLAKAIPIPSREALDQFRSNTQRAFRNELSEHPEVTNTIISAEFLHSRIVTPEDISRFHTLFCTGFDLVTIVVYIRPQLDHVISLYSTVLKVGGYRGTLERFITARTQPEQRAYFDLKAIVSSWVSEFGDDNVLVKPYKAIPRDVGVVQDFCRTVGIDIGAEGAITQGQQNRAISAEAQELLRVVNRHTQDAALRRKIAAWAEKRCVGPGEMPSLDMARKFQSLFTESNRWVISRYFPDHPEYLEPKWPS